MKRKKGNKTSERRKERKGKKKEKRITPSPHFVVFIRVYFKKEERGVTGNGEEMEQVGTKKEEEEEKWRRKWRIKKVRISKALN